MWLRAQEGSGRADFTVTGTTVEAPSGTDELGILVSSGAASSDTVVVCADIGGTTAALRNTFDQGGSAGVPDLAFSRRFGTDLQLVGFTTGGDLTSAVRARNNGAPDVASFDLAPTGRSTPCAQPALPTP
jgi:hypothetical protein